MSHPIRPIEARDAAAVARLTGELGYPTDEAGLLERLTSVVGDPADHVVLVAVDEDDVPVGWAHVERLRLLQRPPSAQLLGLVVGAEHRSGGIGSALLERSEAVARAWGCGALLIRSNVTRAAAHAFYERAGYTGVKISRLFEKRLTDDRAAAATNVEQPKDAGATLSEAWEAEASNWVAWARTPGHDSYWRFHRDRFLELLPPPPARVLDVGCGEGRLPRELTSRGYEVTGIDASPTLIGHARHADPDGDYRVADAARLPLANASVQLVTAFLSLHDMHDMEGAVAEAARVLAAGGRLCAAIVHPINSAGRFEASEPDAAFVIRSSYFEGRPYADTVERNGLRMTFTSRHRPLEAYFAALERSRLLIERLIEVPDTTAPPGDRWRRLPLFLDVRAVKR